MSEVSIQLHDIRVDLPRVPNFVRVTNTKETMLSIGLLSDEALRTIGQAYTLRLLERAKEIRSQE